MGEEYTNGNRAVFSANDLIRYGIVVVAIITFGVTLKSNQVASDERAARLEKKVEELSATVDDLRRQMAEWKYTTSDPDTYFRARGRPFKDVDKR